MTTPVPDEAAAAAERAWRVTAQAGDGVSKRLRAGLDAAAPLIRAAERERTREAIERIERLAGAAQETAIAHAVKAERERLASLLAAEYPGLREWLGRMVREVWVAWAAEQPDPKPSWLVPWEALDAGQREVDMRIGENVAATAHAAERKRIRQMAADLNATVPQAIVNGVALTTVPFADLIAGEESEARQWETGEDGSDA